jgi:hypothetical protein
LKNTVGLSSARELCTQYTDEIWKLNKETEEQEAQLVQLLVRHNNSMRVLLGRSIVLPTESIAYLHLTFMQFLLESRQSKVLEGLRRIYPIVLLESGDYSIRGAELPADLYSTNRYSPCTVILQPSLIIRFFSMRWIHHPSVFVLIFVFNLQQSAGR